MHYFELAHIFAELRDFYNEDGNHYLGNSFAVKIVFNIGFNRSLIRSDRPLRRLRPT